jgi:hypothetical protein
MFHQMLFTGTLATFLWLAVHAAGAAEPPEAAAVPDMQAIEREVGRLRTELGQQQEKYDAMIAELEKEIENLRRASGGDAPPADPDPDLDLDLEGGDDELEGLLGELVGEEEEPLAAEEPSFAASVGQAFQSFNPNISAIGDVLVRYSDREALALDNQFQFRELELGFSAAIDPYARADFFVSLGQDDDGEFSTELEEGYATFLTVPWDLQPRLGKFRASLGKANSLHLHALPWVEYPLVLQNFFGEDGLSGVGAGVNWLIPNPWDKYLELTYEITNTYDVLFAGEESDEFIHLLHQKSFVELSDASTLEVGLSFATEPDLESRERGPVLVEGIDLTYKWRPPGAGLYRAILWQTEAIAGQIDLDRGWEYPWGLFSAVEYQFARRWSTGIRYDFTRHDFTAEPSFDEHAGSAFLTFIQSEFLFWRLAYRYTDHETRVRGYTDEHQVFLQCNFGIGPHRAHKY